MEDLSTKAPVASPPARAEPLENLPDARLLAAQIERAVHLETGRGVRNLSVEVTRKEVLLKGFCSSYYCKQLAQHAAMSVSDAVPLVNSIEVS